jgi:hypothetical protein
MISFPELSGKYSNSTLALAIVACPHRATSMVGVNHLMLIGFLFIFIKAVSDRLFSEAMDCIKSSASVDSKITTAAGLPENNFEAKAST